MIYLEVYWEVLGIPRLNVTQCIFPVSFQFLQSQCFPKKTKLLFEKNSRRGPPLSIAACRNNGSPDKQTEELKNKARVVMMTKSG